MKNSKFADINQAKYAPNQPMAYIAGDLIHSYIKDKHGVYKWVFETDTGIFKEHLSETGFYVFYDMGDNLKFAESKNNNILDADNRRNTAGVQCQTIKAQDLRIILANFYKKMGITSKMPENYGLTSMCLDLGHLSVSAEIKQFDEFVRLGEPEDFEFARWIYLINVKRKKSMISI